MDPSPQDHGQEKDCCDKGKKGNGGSAFKHCCSLFTPNGNRFVKGLLLIAMGQGGAAVSLGTKLLFIFPPWGRSLKKGLRAGRMGSVPPGGSSACYGKLLCESGLGTGCPLLGCDF